MQNLPLAELLFIKAGDPKLLRGRYRRHLGLDTNEQYGDCTLPLNQQQAGSYSVFSVFGEESKCFDPSAKPFMLNFRVADLSATLTALRAAGWAVGDKEERSESGNFGWVMDPEDHLIELWKQRLHARPSARQRWSREGPHREI